MLEIGEEVHDESEVAPGVEPPHDELADTGEHGGRVQLSLHGHLRELRPPKADQLQRVAEGSQQLDGVRAEVRAIGEPVIDDHLDEGGT